MGEGIKVIPILPAVVLKLPDHGHHLGHFKSNDARFLAERCALHLPEVWMDVCTFCRSSGALLCRAGHRCPGYGCQGGIETTFLFLTHFFTSSSGSSVLLGNWPG